MGQKPDFFRKFLQVGLAFLLLGLTGCEGRLASQASSEIISEFLTFRAGKISFLPASVARYRGSNAFLLFNRKTRALTPGGPIRQSPLFIHELHWTGQKWELPEVANPRLPALFDYPAFIAAASDLTGEGHFFLATSFETPEGATEGLVRISMGKGGELSLRFDPQLTRTISNLRSYLGMNYIMVSGLELSPDGRFLFVALGYVGLSWERRRPVVMMFRIDLTRPSARPIRVLDFNPKAVVGVPESCTGLAYDPSGDRYLFTTALAVPTRAKAMGHIWAVDRGSLEKPRPKGSIRPALGPGFAAFPMGLACDEAGRILVVFALDAPDGPFGRFVVLENPSFK
jgi:hypothetical protein